MRHIIKGQDLYYQYARFDEEAPAHEALSGINFEVSEGEFIAVLGANGSGKSTLAKHINALLAPTSGTLLVHGLDTSDEHNIWSIRQQTGMVFQNPDNQLIATIVEEDIAFGPENLGIPPAEIAARVAESLQNVSMTEFSAAQPHQLSGGQKQRIAIAGVLAMRPSTIILDEPTAMLDPIGRREVMETILRLNTEQNITIILITHFMEEAARAGRIIVMDKGRIVMDAPPREVFAQSRLLQELGLSLPASAALAETLRGRGLPLPESIINKEEFCAAYMKLASDFSARNTRRDTAHRVRENAREQEGEQAESQPVTERNRLQAAPENPKLSVANLRHTYDSGTPFERHAVDNINLNIRQGEFVAIIGATGSGKSTMVQHFNALLKPTSGSVLLDNTDIFADKSKLKSVRQRVGLIFQYPEHQLFEMTVFKDIAFGPANIGLAEPEISARVKEAIALVGLDEDILDKSPFELSGGQKRRVAIAGVLAMKPEILILDEPTAGLDPAARREILGQVSDMHKQLGITVIMVSHNMEEVSALAQRIFVLHKGAIVQQGSPAQVFAHVRQIQEIGLDAPEITQLMNMLHTEEPSGIFTVQEAADALMANRYG